MLLLLVSVALCCLQEAAPDVDADMQSTELLADESTTETLEPKAAALSPFPANPWSSAVQHQTSGPPKTASFTGPTPIHDPSTSSLPSREADANVASSTHASREESSNDFAYGRPNFLFTAVPMLGPPMQPHDDPMAPPTAADAENDEDIVQSFDKYVKLSIVTASAKRRTLKTLTSNSLSLAAAIQEAGEATAAGTAPDPDGNVSLVSDCWLDILFCSMLTAYAHNT